MFAHIADFKRLCGESFIHSLHEKRKKRKEIQRDRLLGTLEVLWLLVGMAAFSHLPNLVEIIQQVQHGLSLQSTISVTAFCKARDAFSPSTCSRLLATY